MPAWHFFLVSVLGDALFLERFDYENGELAQASSNRWTPTTTESGNPNLHVVDGQLVWDFTGQVADPVNNGYYGTIFASSRFSSGSLYTYFDLEVTEAPIGTVNTAGIFLAMWNGAGGYRSRVFIAAVPDGEGGIVPDRFRLGITKQSGSRFSAEYYPEDWPEGTKLTVLLESDFDEEMVRLYINPEAESDRHAEASDGSFLPIQGVAIRHRDESREGNNIGVFRVDNIAVTQTFGDVEAPPELPPGKVAVYGVPGGGISVNWSDNSNNESGFRVERRASGESDFEALDVVEANRTHYLDSSADVGIEWEYRIVALGEAELSSDWGQGVRRYGDLPPLTAPVLKGRKEGSGLSVKFPAIPQVTYEVQESIDLENWSFFRYLQSDWEGELSLVLQAGEFGRRFARIAPTRFSIPPHAIGLTEVFKMPENGTGSVFSLLDFGATPGVPEDDDAIAIRSALSAMAFGDILEVEAGNYHLKTTVVVPGGLTIRAAQRQSRCFTLPELLRPSSFHPPPMTLPWPGLRYWVRMNAQLRSGSRLVQSTRTGTDMAEGLAHRRVCPSRHSIAVDQARKSGKLPHSECHRTGRGRTWLWVELDGPDCHNNWITGCRIGPVIRHGVLLQYSAHNNLVENNTCFETTEDAYDLHGEDEYANELRFNLAYWDGDPAGTPAGFGIGNTGSTHDNSGPGNWIHHNEVRGYQIGVEVIQGSHVQFIDANDLRDNADAGIKIHNGGGTAFT